MHYLGNLIYSINYTQLYVCAQSYYVWNSIVHVVLPYVHICDLSVTSIAKFWDALATLAVCTVILSFSFAFRVSLKMAMIT